MAPKITPTAEDIAIANAIIARVTVGKKRWTVFAPGDFATGAHLMAKYNSHKANPCCNVEKIWLHDRLRELVGMTYARNQLPEDRIEARKYICHGCPAYHHSTDSCGRIILDAISPTPVEIDGRMVNPCGCIITLKAMFKSEECPANKWPN